MKKGLLIILATILIFNCELKYTGVGAQLKQEKELDNLFQKELLKHDSNDTIFLDFTFKMSMIDYIKHAADLHVQKKIEYINGDFNYNFDFGIDGYYKGHAIPEFHNDTLYKLRIIAIDTTQFSSEDNIDMDSFINSFSNKYGKNTLLHVNEKGDNQWKWITNKRYIELGYEKNKAIITYEDLRVKVLLQEKKDSLSEVETTKSINEIQEKRIIIESDL